MLKWKTRAFWRDAGRLIGAFLIKGLILSFGTEAIYRIWELIRGEKNMAPILSIEFYGFGISMFSLGGIALIVAALIFSYGTIRTSLSQRSALRPSAYVFGPLALILTFMAASFFSKVLNLIKFDIVEKMEPIVHIGTNTLLVCGVFVIGVLAPFGQELFYRGFLMEVLSRWLSRGWAIVLSAVSFSMLSVHFGYILFLLISGLILGVLTFASGSLRLAIVCNIINNIFMVLLVFFFFDVSDIVSGVMGASTRAVFSASLGVACLLAALASTAAAVGGFGALRVAFTGAEPEPAAESPTSQTAESAEMT